MAEDDGSGGKKSSTQTMDFSNVDWAALRSGKGHLPFAESEAPPAREGPPANKGDGALPFAPDQAAQSGSQWPAPHPPARGPSQPPPQPPPPPHPSQPGPPPPHPSQPGMAPPHPSQPGLPPHPSQPGLPRHPSQPAPPTHPSPHVGQPAAPSQPSRPSQPVQAVSYPAPSSAVPQPPAAPSADGSSPWAGGASKVAVSAPQVRPPVPSAAPGVPVAAPQRIEAAAHAARSSEGLAFLWAQPGCALRFHRHPPFKALINALEDRPVDIELDGAASEDDELSVEDRREIFEVLARGTTTDGSGLRKANQSSLRDDGKFVAPLVLVAADLTTPFDERERLRCTITTVTPFLPPPPEQPKEEGASKPKPSPLTECVDDAKTFLDDSDDLCAPSVFDGFTKRIVETFEAQDRELPHGYLESSSERALLQKRKYQTRLLFGGAHLRTLLHVIGCEEPVPTYLPESLASELPLYARFGVRIVAELLHRQDQYESSELALRVLAIARVLPRHG